MERFRPEGDKIVLTEEGIQYILQAIDNGTVPNLPPNQFDQVKAVATPAQMERWAKGWQKITDHYRATLERHFRETAAA